MDNASWQRIAETPWWIYLLIAYALNLGYLASKPRIILGKQLLFLPVMAIIFSLLNLIFALQGDVESLLMWITVFLFSAGIGWLQFRFGRVTVIKNENKIRLSGSWSLLIFLLISLAAIWFTPQTLINLYALLGSSQWFLLGYGLFAGLFLGRWIYAKRCMQE